MFFIPSNGIISASQGKNVLSGRYMPVWVTKQIKGDCYMKKILVLDGDAVSRDRLNNIIRGIEVNTAVYETDNLADAFGIAMTNSISLFIVDIILESERRSSDNSGVSFILKMRGVAKYRYTPVIVVSGVCDEGMFLYSHAHIYRYFEKPFDAGPVKRIIEEALEIENDVVSRRPEKVIYQVEGLLECIDIDKIIYAQSNNHSMRIVTAEKEYAIPYLTCKKLLGDIDDRSFVMCFRGCIVNVRHIKNIDKVNRYITMHGCVDKLGIGLKYKKILVEAFLRRNN